VYETEVECSVVCCSFMSSSVRGRVYYISAYIVCFSYVLYFHLCPIQTSVFITHNIPIVRATIGSSTYSESLSSHLFSIVSSFSPSSLYLIFYSFSISPLLLFPPFPVSLSPLYSTTNLSLFSHRSFLAPSSPLHSTLPRSASLSFTSQQLSKQRSSASATPSLSIDMISPSCTSRTNSIEFSRIITERCQR
jgi:hypothetical protein